MEEVLLNIIVLAVVVLCHNLVFCFAEVDPVLVCEDGDEIIDLII
jgi:hypothetical protein